MRRKPNPEQRRRVLCDAAIRLLARDGVKGLSHLKVDRETGLSDGTTSFYFRTRSALLHAVAERVAELDLADLSAATSDDVDPSPDRPAPPSGLAALVVRSASGARLVRTQARIELALQAARDPALDAVLTRHGAEFFALIRDAVLRFQPADPDPAPALLDKQTYVVMTFIGGLMAAFARGDRRIRTAQELDLVIAGIVRGIAIS